MDRRQFLGVGGAAAATLAAPAVLLAKRPEVAYTERLLATALANAFGAPPAPSTAGTITVNVNSEFIEDYTFGVPFTGSPLALETPYVSRDGRTQLITFVGGWSGQSPDALMRIFPDPINAASEASDSMTGWSYQSVPLPPAPNIKGAPSSVGPIAVIVPSDQGDRLLIYRQAQIQSSMLAPDGSPGPVTFAAQKFYSKPLMTGQLDPSTVYIPEWVIPASETNSSWGGLGLRHAKTLALIRVNGSFTSPIQKVFCLLPHSDDTYVCVLQEGTGDLSALMLSLGTDKGQQVFNVTGRAKMANAPTGAVFVTQNFNGAIELYNFDLVHGRFQHYQGSYDADRGFVSMNGQSDKAFSEFHMPNFPAGTTYDLDATWNGDAQRWELIFVVREPSVNADGSAKQQPLAEVWTTVMGRGGIWMNPTLVERGVISARVCRHSEVTLAVSKPRTGWEIWERNADGDWNTDHIRIENESGKMVESAGYRVGISVVRDNEPISSANLGLTASVSTSAVINGRHGTLNLTQPWKAMCDPSGTLWVTVLLEDRISFPQLIVSSPLFPEKLVLDLNRKVEGFLSNVSGDGLMKARDPRRCTDEQQEGCPVEELAAGLDTAGGRGGVTDQGRADNAAKLIRETLAAAPPIERLSPKSSASIVLVSDVSAGWLPQGVDITELRSLRPERAPSWVMSQRDGKAHIELVSAEHSAALIKEWNQLYPAYYGVFDFFSDAIEAIGDLGKSLYDGVCQVLDAAVSAVADGIKIAVNIVVDGVRWVYNAVIDTIDMVMDAIDFFLEYAGMAIGMAVGWILEQLGFLFDWKAIKQRRNQLKSMISSRLRPSLNRLGNPVQGAHALIQHLDGLKSQIFTAVNAIRSTPADRNAYNTGPNKEGAIESLSFLDNFSLMPQLTWMLDKLQGVFPRLGGDLPSLAIDKLEDLVAACFNAFGQVGDAILSILTDIINMLDEWVVQGKLFTSAALDPMLDFMARLAGRVVDLLKAVVEKAGDLLGACVSAAEKFVEWFDQTLPFPGVFRGFYKGLTGNSPSPLDIVCLLAAIPEIAGGYEAAELERPLPGWNRHEISHTEHVARSLEAHPWLQAALYHPQARRAALSYAGTAGSGKTPKDSKVGQAAIAFSSIGCVTNALATGFGAAITRAPWVDVWSDRLTILNLTATGCFFILELSDSGESPVWIAAATSGLVGVVALAGSFALRRSSRVQDAIHNIPRSADDASFYILLGCAAFELIGMAAALGSGSNDEGVGLAVGCVQMLYAAAIRYKRPYSLPVAAALGAGQGALSGIKTWIYADRPISTY